LPVFVASDVIKSVPLVDLYVAPDVFLAGFTYSAPPFQASG